MGKKEKMYHTIRTQNKIKLISMISKFPLNIKKNRHYAEEYKTEKSGCRRKIPGNSIWIYSVALCLTLQIESE